MKSQKFGWFGDGNKRAVLRNYVALPLRLTVPNSHRLEGIEAPDHAIKSDVENTE